MNCAYVSALFTAINFALERNANLFLAEEIQLLQSFYSLPYDSSRIFGRLITRKSKWVKSTKLVEYVKGTGDPVNAVAAAVDALLNRGLMETLSAEKNFEIVWNTAEQSFANEDWVWITQKITNSKPKATKKEDVLRSLRRNIETQKTFFGKSLKVRFVEVVHELLQAVHRTHLVRIPDQHLVLIRRVQRLLQVPSNVSGQTGGLSSAYRPLEVSVPLWVTFKMLRFPAYSLQLPAVESSDSKTDVARFMSPGGTERHMNASFLFPSRDIFRQWEGAVELRYLLFELDPMGHQDAAITSAYYRSVYQMLHEHIAVTLSSPSFMNHYFIPIDSTNNFSLNNASLSRILLVMHILTGYSSDKVPDSAGSLQIQIGFVTLLSSIALVHQHQYVVTAEDVDYLTRYRAGAHLAYGVVELASTLEKVSVRKFVLAILCYEWLLLLPFVRHRRGRWWKRMAVDCEQHLKKPQYALRAIERGLQDEVILESDEVDLLDRAKILRQRLQRINEQQRAREAIERRKREKSTAKRKGPNKRKACYDDTSSGHLNDVQIVEEGKAADVNDRSRQKKSRPSPTIKDPIEENGSILLLESSDDEDIPPLDHDVLLESANQRPPSSSSCPSVKLEDDVSNNADESGDEAEAENRRHTELILAMLNDDKHFLSRPAHERRAVLAALLLEELWRLNQAQYMDDLAVMLAEAEATTVSTEKKRTTTGSGNDVKGEQVGWTGSSIASVQSAGRTELQKAQEWHHALSLPVPTGIKIEPDSNNASATKAISSATSALGLRKSYSTSTKETRGVVSSKSDAPSASKANFFSNNKNNDSASKDVKWSCHVCTFLNTPKRFSLSCEMCGVARNNSQQRSTRKSIAQSDDNDSIMLIDGSDAKESTLPHPENVVPVKVEQSDAQPPLARSLATELSRAATGVAKLAKDEVVILLTDDEVEESEDAETTATDVMISDAPPQVQSTVTPTTSVDTLVKADAMKCDKDMGAVPSDVVKGVLPPYLPDKWLFQVLVATHLAQYQQQRDEAAKARAEIIKVDGSACDLGDEDMLLHTANFSKDVQVDSGASRPEGILAQCLYTFQSLMTAQQHRLQQHQRHLQHTTLPLSLNSSRQYDVIDSGDHRFDSPSKHHARAQEQQSTPQLLSPQQRQSVLSLSPFKRQFSSPLRLLQSPNASASTLPSQQQEQLAGYTGDAFTVHSRRLFLTNTTKATEENDDEIVESTAGKTGKSKFYGHQTDNVIHVEELVMQKLQIYDADEESHAQSILDSQAPLPQPQEVKNQLRNFRMLPYCALFGPSEHLHQTVGNNDEATSSFVPSSSYTRGLESLGDGWQGWHCEGSIVRILYGLLMWDVFYLPRPAVLLTPYQDAPLDFPYPSFYQSRQEEILQRVYDLRYGRLAQPSSLLAELQRVYVSQYGCSSRIVSGWDSYSLRALQLAALCLGPVSLAKLCLAMSINYQQWSSGAPDLFLIRVSKVSRSTNSSITLSATENRTSNKANSALGTHPSTTTGCNSANRMTLSLESLLGEGWDQRLSAASTTWGGSGSGRGRANDEDGGIFGENLFAPLSSTASKGRGTSGNPQRWQHRNKNSNALPDSRMAEEKDDEEGEEPSIPVVANADESSKDQENMQFLPLQLPAISGDETFVFESMFVEVKGPSDHLAYKQWLWLRLLSLRCPEDSEVSGEDYIRRSDDATSAFHYVHRPVKAFVCHVREDVPDKGQVPLKRPADGTKSKSSGSRSKKRKTQVGRSDASESVVDSTVDIDPEVLIDDDFFGI